MWQRSLLNLIRQKGIQVLLVLSIIVTLVSFVLSKIGENKISYNQERVVHTYRVIQQADLLNSLLKDAETGERGYLLTLESKYLAPYEEAKNKIAQTQDKLRELVANTPEQAERAKKLETLTAQKLEEMEQTIQLAQSSGQQSAISLLQADKGKVIMDNIRQVVKEFNAKQLALIDSRNEELELTMLISRVIQWLSTIFNLTILGVAFYTIVKERASRKKLFRELDQNNKELLFNNGIELNDEEDEKLVVQNLINSLQNATEFIKEVGQSNYQTPYTGITDDNKELNHDNLAGELLRMRDQLTQVAEEERRRNWTTNGVAQFAEILRTERNNLSELADTIIANLVKYVGANQGGLFVLEGEDGDEPYLKLQACYAYNRKKYINKQIQPGEGLVGQAYLEQDIIFLTEVPQNYVHITSGLGDATPRCLLLVPLKINEQVLGVIELASFKILEKFEIEFVQKVAESIASTITSVKTNEVTKRLLVDAQHMTEEMKAQEEEMRQNMEELSATQEEMQRKEREYVNRIQELEAQLQKA